MAVLRYGGKVEAMRKVLALVTAAVVVASCGPSAGPHAEAAHTAQKSLEWRGSEEADVVLLAGRAQSHLLQVGVRDDRETLREQLDRLLELRIAGAHSDAWGWGLSYPWDAFGDDVVNPKDTIYSYTTAAAALALMDGYEVLGDPNILVPPSVVLKRY